MSVTIAVFAASTVRVGHLGGGEPLNVPVLRIVLVLAICLMIAVLAILLLRQRRGHDNLRRWTIGLSHSTRAIDVVEVRRLGVHADIGLVRHSGREYLLVVQSAGTQVLHAGDSLPGGDEGEAA